MIKKVSRDFVFEFAVRYFPDFPLKKDVFSRDLVYISGDTIIGFVTYSVIYERAEIQFIAVDEKYRGRGIADDLMGAFLSDVSNCDNISLEVREDNTPAINLYLKHGFRKVSVRKNYYLDCDGILMVKKLEVI